MKFLLMNMPATRPARDKFHALMVCLAIMFAACCFCSILDYSLIANRDSLTYACLWAIIAMMALIAANTGTASNFLFSSAFWVTVTFCFYILLKTLDVIGEVDSVLLQKALALSLLFLTGYLAGQFLWPIANVLRPPLQKSVELARPSLRLYYWLLLCFIVFKLIELTLHLSVGGGSTALEISAATQNQGASYLFKIPVLANASYFFILLFAYKFGKFRRTALLMTLWMIVDAVFSAGRYALVTTILINLLLYHMYVRPLRLFYLILIAPPMVFAISFFGYIRNVEIGNLSIFKDALNIFIEDYDLIFKLFMSRMDMLPQMIQALSMDQTHQLKFEGGLSYVYSLLHAIPRSLWADKPPLTAAYVTELVNPGVFSDGVNIYPSIMIEAYMNFLWTGPIIIGLIVSRMSAWYDKVLRRGSLSGQTFALMAFTFPMALINEGIHSNIFATLIYLFFLYSLWLAATQAFIGRRSFLRLTQP